MGVSFTWIALLVIAVLVIIMYRHKKTKPNLLIGCTEECILSWNQKGLFVTLFGGYLVWFCLTVTCEHVSWELSVPPCNMWHFSRSVQVCSLSTLCCWIIKSAFWVIWGAYYMVNFSQGLISRFIFLLLTSCFIAYTVWQCSCRSSRFSLGLKFGCNYMRFLTLLEKPGRKFWTLSM